MDLQVIKHIIICALESYRELRETEIQEKLRIPANIKSHKEIIRQVSKVLDFVKKDGITIKEN